MMRFPFIIALALAGVRCAADLPPVEVSAVIPATPSQVWAAFTTTEGVKSWMVSQADIELKVGAVWRTRYGKDGTLGDEGTIFNELLAFDPGRMYAIRIQKPPKKFPFMNAYRDMWTVIYFEPMEGGRTKVTARTLGLKDDDESRKMQAFFKLGNQYTLDEAAKHFAPKSAAK